ncbi:MAG: GAF domain-containing protein [Dehalococcoidia bacterium]|nr:GAF domain-containing protein [Dehalococcoidia bacterium]
MPRIPSLTLRARLLLLVALAVLPALALVFWTTAERRDRAHDDATAETLQLSDLVARDVSASIQHARRVLRALAAVPEIRAVDPEACQSILRSVRPENPELGVLWVANMDGDVLCSSTDRTSRLSVAGLDAFQEAVATSRHASGGYVTTEPLTGRAAVSFAEPIDGEKGLPVAIIGGAFDIEAINHIGSATTLPPNSISVLLDRTGKILFRSAEWERLAGTNIEQSRLNEVAVAGEPVPGSLTSRDADGVERLYGYKPVFSDEGVIAYVAVGVPTSTVYADVDRSLRQNLLGLGVVALLALAAAWAIGDLFVLRRVRALLEGTRAVARGDYAVHIPQMHGNDELSMLAASFNDMTSELSGRELELREREQLYRSMFEATSDGMLILDTGMQVVTVNPALCRMHGRSADEFTTVAVTEFLHPQYQSLVRALVQGARQGQGHRVRAVALRADHSEFPVEIFATPITYQGEAHVLAVVRDITEQVETEAVLERLVDERTREIGTLLEVSNSLSSTLEPRELVEQIVQKLKEIVDYQAAGILTYESGFLTILGGHREPGDYSSPLAVGLRFPVTRLKRIWEALEQGRAVVVDDARGDDPIAIDYREANGGDAAFISTNPHIRAWLAVPMVVNDRVVGMLNMSRPEVGYFTRRHADVALAFAAQAGIAIENARLFAAATERGRELEAVVNAARAAASTLDLAQLVNVLLDQLREVVGYSGATLFTSDEDDLVVLQARTPAQPLGAPSTVGLRYSLAQADDFKEILQRGQTVIIDDVFDGSMAARRYREVLGPQLASEPFEYVRSWMAVPLLNQDRIIGVLSLSGERPGHYGRRHANVALGIASHAAAAIENARLFEETGARSRELGTLLDVSRGLASTLNLEELLSLVLDRLDEVVGYRAASIQVIENNVPRVLQRRGPSISEYEARARLETGRDTTGYLARELSQGRFVAIDDVRGDTVAAKAYQAFAGTALDDAFTYIVSWLAIPLVSKGTTFGYVALAFDVAGYYTPERVRLARGIADFIAVAIENARLFSETEARSREAETLLDVSLSTAQTLDLQPLLGSILQNLRRVIPYSGSAIIRMERDEVVIIESRGEFEREDAAIGLRLAIPPGNHLVECMRRGEPSITPDVRGDDEHALAAKELLGAHMGDHAFSYIRSQIMVPLIAQDRVIGALTVSRHEVDAFRPEHVRLATAFASQAAVAIQNAELFAQRGQRLRETEALARIASQLTLDQPMTRTLTEMAADAREATGALAASITLHDDGDPFRLTSWGASGLPDGFTEAIGAAIVASGVSPAGMVAESRRPMVLRDARTQMLLSPLPAHIQTYLRDTRWESAVVTPLHYHDDFLGTLNTFHAGSDPYTAEIAPIMTAVANQAAVAVQNARLFAESERGRRQSEALARIAATLTFDRPLQEVLDALAEDVVRGTSAIGCAVMLDQVEGVPLGVGGSHGLPEGYLAEFHRIAMQFAAEDPAYFSDVAVLPDARRRVLAHPGFADLRPLLGNVEWESVVRVPFVYRDRLRGVLVLYYREGELPGATEVAFLRAIASQASVAIENARLFSELSDRNRQLETLYQADQELHRSLRLDDVLRALLDAVTGMLGPDYSSLTMWDAGTLRPAIIASSNAPEEAVDRVADSFAEAGRAEVFERIGLRGPGYVFTASELRPAGTQGRAYALGIRALIEVPVFVNGELFAVLNGAYTSPHHWTPDEQRLFTALARRAALAIENARLYEQAQSLAAVEERQRLARELHDSVSQALYGIALGARTARTLLDRSPEKAKDPVDYVLSLAEAGLAEMRALIFELRPESLEGEGLVAAIKKQVASTRARYGVEVDADLCDEPGTTLPAKEALYRIAQEGLHNVVKHARATHVDLKLECVGGMATLDIRDNGTGFDSGGEFPGHLGLRSMRERATRLGGTFEVESEPGKGTHLRAVVPLTLEELPR